MKHDFFVAGVAYHDYQLVKNLKAGLPVTLIGEPSNPNDCRAIKVMLGEHLLGYVPRNETSVFWNVKERGHRIKATILAYNKNNPSWTCLRVRAVWNEPKKSSKSNLTF